MATPQKRRLITQLPEVHQTDTLKNFFAATVDNLFQPGMSESFSGYVGQKPTYYNANTDVYLNSGAGLRSAYQLEPGMVSSNSGGVTTDALCYDDLVNYLRSQGASVDNHSRMFEGDYYSWAPPVDLDKLNNYLQYVWLGSLSNAELTSTTITLRAPRARFSFDGNTAVNRYALPPSSLLPEASESPVVMVNGVLVDSSVDTSGNAIIDTTALNSGDVIETIRYGDMKSAIDGLTIFDMRPFLQWAPTLSGVVGNTYVQAYYRQYNVGDLAYAQSLSGASYVYRCIEAHTASQSFDETQWVVAINATYATTGTRATFVDGKGSRSFIFDGVGSSISLSIDHSSSSGGAIPQYIVLDRRSQENSPWAKRNMWVHISSLAWTGQTFVSRIAARPILEFIPNIDLYNYGSNRLPDVQAIMTDNTNPNWISSLPAGNIEVDHSYILQPGDRLYLAQTNNASPYNYAIYDVIGTNSNAVTLILDQHVPTIGDVFCVSPPDSQSVFVDKSEFWFNGESWLTAQAGSATPLFMLYDSEQNALNDQNVYPGTNFVGSRLFGYQVGTGVQDTILGFPLNYDSYGNPIFEVDSYVNKVTYSGGTINQYYYYKCGSQYLNNWYTVANTSSQALINGYYTVPDNLQGNPNNLEVSTISRSQWFDHFSDIMLNQAGFVGEPYSVNNWRDTQKILGNGKKILQHRSPLLKTMLVCSNSDYDLLASLRYADQEYTRFRNKFVQMMLDFHHNGTKLETDTPEIWVTSILAQLRLHKSSAFPFWGSSMAGGQYFIPPTPASFGLSEVKIPEIVLDTSFKHPMNVIVGHDGSRAPAFGDFRDSVMLALEQLIYDNIPSKFKAEDRPVFDFDAKISGKFFTSDYSRDEINTMLAPYFEKWAQNNRLEYHNNNTYDANDPFTWNYSGCADRDGAPVPGNWKEIYLRYFDTVRPHLAPWEMLGFVDEPEWWTPTYGAAPYTRGNEKMWNDLSSGSIAFGPRAGISLRYARPNLSTKYIPVDYLGNLLNPIECGIIVKQPNAQDAASSWEFGDGGPVESLWRNSSSYRFAVAQVGFLTKPARFVEQGWDTVNTILSGGQWIYAPTGNRPLNSRLYVHGEVDPNGNIVKNVGVQQWISDFIISRGQAPSIFGSAVRGLDVRLIHKTSSFILTDNLRVLADNFGLVPNENINVQLYETPSTREEVYSGVLIEKHGQGWRVVGYNVQNPNFKIIPPNTSGPSGIISLATGPEPKINAWRRNVYYPVGVNVDYQNTIYTSVKGHTSGGTFSEQYWTLASTMTQQAPRVTTYLLGLDTVQTVPYGTVFATYQQVSDFLLGYERYLVSCGWIFDDITADQTVLNWSMAVKEFLAWAQVHWQQGTFITLSPGSQGVKFFSDVGMILDVLNPINSTYGMIDRAGLPIDRQNVVINRIDGNINLLSKNNDVFGAKISIGEIEHVIIFDNTTIFNDIIYDPLFNLRQPRLRLIGNQATNWTGRLDAPGFILLENKLVPNFDKAATDLLTMFDIEKADNVQLSNHARHVIGYDSRDYLSSLVLSEIEQFEFYQGMIHQKGAIGAFNKLLRSDTIEQQNSLNFFEEWAFKIDEYGSVNRSTRISFLLGQSVIKTDPQYIQFCSIPVSPNLRWIQIVDDTVAGLDPKWIERPTNPSCAFPQRSTLTPKENDLPVSGYVRLSEINYSVFNSADMPLLYDGTNALSTGEAIWVHKANTDWDVLKIYNMDANAAVNTVNSVVTYNEDQNVPNTITRVFTINPHGLTSSDVGLNFIIDGLTHSDPELIGFNTIYAVDAANNSIDIATTGKTGNYFGVNGLIGPAVRILHSIHFANTVSFVNSQNRIGIKDGDIAYVDGSPWQVFKRSSSVTETDDLGANVVTHNWSSYRSQPKRMDGSRVVSSLIYDLKTKITPTDLRPEPLVLENFSVVSPLTGIVPGVAFKEIDYLLEFDPAKYSDTSIYDSVAGQDSISSPMILDYTATGTSVNGWGKEQLGRLWWDLSTVRFLETETDNVVFGLSDPTKYESEVQYRINNWGSIAPSTTVDVYEWVKSAVDPFTYASLTLTDTTGTYVGQVYNSDLPSWVEVEEIDPVTHRNTIFYYFWVKGLTTVPPVSFRKIPASTVAQFITNPMIEDNPWIAPIMPNGILVGGVSPYLNDNFEQVDGPANSGTVLQLDISNLKEGVIHDEWLLLRPKDELSLPPDWLWTDLRNSLVGFDDNGNLIPMPFVTPSLNPPTNYPPVWITPAGPLSNPGGAHDPDYYEGDTLSITLQAVDQGNLQPILYTLIGGTLPYGAIFNETGIITGTPTLWDVDNDTHRTSDYTWSFTVRASYGALYTDRTFSLTIKYLNLPPVWSTTAGNILTANETTAVSLTLLATDPQSAAITYSVASGSLPAGVSLNASTGQLTGTLPSVGRGNQTWSFTIQATNTFTLYSQRTFSITSVNVNHAPVWVTTGNIGVFPENAFSSYQLVATDADSDALTYTLTNGTLPAGFVLNSASGLLSGTLSSVAQTTVYPFTVQVSDGLATANTTLNATVQYINLPPVWSTPAGTLGGSNAVGWAFTYQLAATDPEGNTVTYSTTDSLPSGITLSNAGLVSGTLPSVLSNTIANFTVSAYDGYQSIPRTFGISTAYTAPSWYTSSGSIGNGYGSDHVAIQLLANTYSAPVTFSLTNSSTLPASLTMNSGGYISGTLTSVLSNTTTNFQVTITDGTTTIPRNFSYTVNNVPVSGNTSITPVTLQFSSNGSYTVPDGVGDIMFNWIIGGGGGGGSSIAENYGGAGAGGGSGGYLHYYLVTCSPGDVFTFAVGNAGVGANSATSYYANGTDGTATTIYQNGNAVISVQGGRGGNESVNGGTGLIIAAGGGGGSPSGTPGADGIYGTNSYAVVNGGAGAAGPLISSYGGVGGLANGTAVVSTSIYNPGGNGVGGFVQLTAPSQGPVGGVAAGSGGVGTAVTTASGGTGSGYGSGGGGAGTTRPAVVGGGGGGCAWIEAMLPSGMRVGDAKVGAELLMLGESGNDYFTHHIESVRHDVQECYRIATSNGVELTCSTSTPIIVLRDGVPISIDLVDCLGEFVPVLSDDEFSWVRVVQLTQVGKLPVALISANNGVYASGDNVGKYIFTHNSPNSPFYGIVKD